MRAILLLFVELQNIYLNVYCLFPDSLWQSETGVVRTFLIIHPLKNILNVVLWVQANLSFYNFPILNN